MFSLLFIISSDGGKGSYCASAYTDTKNMNIINGFIHAFKNMTMPMFKNKMEFGSSNCPRPLGTSLLGGATSTE